MRSKRRGNDRGCRPGRPCARPALPGRQQYVGGGRDLRAVVEEAPDCIEAWLLLSELAGARGDLPRARKCVDAAARHAPEVAAVALQRGQLLLAAGELADAADTLAALLARQPKQYVAWLLLGQVFDLAGQTQLALRAWSQGLRHGQASRHLMGMASTPPAFRPHIQQIIARVNAHLYAPAVEGFERMRAQFGAADLARLGRALSSYTGVRREVPPNPHQRPKFLYFAGLPEGPYHDPYLHPWTAGLVDAFDTIRAEALAVLDAQAGLQEFLEFAPGQSRDGYLGGSGSKPSWDAFFFYRHGQRYDDNHARCPATSKLLDGIELCEVAGQAPEICFSVLQPGTHIMPHYGATNTRLVLHLPLLVPSGCALNVRGGGEHAWREREPMMFDDTFEHEAWNRSGQARVILLMDCWNPHLTPAERIATRHVVELISAIEHFAPGELDRAVQALRG
ncbi:aspartyl/asparaginyl beta-hydroxylase domain-containing protein [Massilia sp. Se16.2.3]|uniref:aspartyl/asparaginyl beta-hydroxylase domain-containing protein n=1 Tax=Massilia sp. Se16.2.3 TaxID=2709303 RepID=UPI0035A6EF85